MANTMLVFVEQRGGEIKKNSLEALSLAKELVGSDVVAVVVGKGVADLVPEIGAHGANTVYVAESEALELYSTDAYATAVARAAEAAGAKVILAGASAMGKDLAPRIAARLEYDFLADVTAAQVEDGRLVVSRPQYAGKTMWKCAAPLAKLVVTSRPNVFTAVREEGASPETVAVDVSDVVPKGRVTSFHSAEKGTVDVAEAEVVVSGGRGLKGPENFPMVFDLAKALGAGVGASRAVVDAGWIDHDHQVGQTGKTVSPNLYVACGISGAIQHLAGMTTSKRIVAINKDAEAPIFKVADYGLVGDVFEILPQLTQEIEKAKA